MVNNEYLHFDANLVINYIIESKENTRSLDKYFKPSNFGNRIIIISIDELGELSKRISRCFNENNGNLSARIQKKIRSLTDLMRKEKIQLKGFKELIGDDNAKLTKFLEIVNEVSKWLDNRVQMSDQIHLSLFALDEAGIYYTNDRNILKSTKLVDYFKEKHSKSIKEPS